MKVNMKLIIKSGDQTFELENVQLAQEELSGNATFFIKSKVKVLRELTEAEVSLKASAHEFVEFACSVNRMEQGVSKLTEMGLPVDNTSMSAYLKWLGGDILSECEETLVKSGIERKAVMPLVAQKGRNWFLNYVRDQAFVS